MIELQKSYAQDLLTHKNPYTGLRYVDEPAIIVVEINNENTLIGTNWFGSLDSLPDFYAKELTGLWNSWLRKKYVNIVGLNKAWSANDKPFGPNLTRMGAAGWGVENNTAPAASQVLSPDQNALPPKGVKAPVVAIEVTKAGAQNWNVQYNRVGLDLKEGETYSFSFWAKADKPRKFAVNGSADRIDYHSIGLSDSANVTTSWKHFAFSFKASRVDAMHNRVGLFIGDAKGRIDFCDLSVNVGVKTELPSNLNLESGQIPLGTSSETPIGKDWTSFLVHLESNYVSEMRGFLKNDLKLKSMVICSQANFGGVAGIVREMPNDFIDTHSYWQHPSFPHVSWDSNDWLIANTPMYASATGGEFNQLVRYRVAGKPYTVSEYMHPAPNDYQAECVPMLVSIAAVQDWDGFYLFDYGMDHGENKISGYFAIDSNPSKMALLPAMARLFLRGDVPPISSTQTSRLNSSNINSVISLVGFEIGALRPKVEIDAHTLSTTRYTQEFRHIPETPSPFLNISSIILKSPLAMTRVAKLMGSQFYVNSRRSKVALGDLGGAEAKFVDWKVDIKKGGTLHDFGVLTLTSLDGIAISGSKSLLLTAIVRAENQGMNWNESRTTTGDKWGKGPTIVEGLTGTCTLSTKASVAAVYALDSVGKRKMAIPSALKDGKLTFSLSSEYKTVWYEVALKQDENEGFG